MRLHVSTIPVTCKALRTVYADIFHAQLEPRPIAGQLCLFISTWLLCLDGEVCFVSLDNYRFPPSLSVQWSSFPNPQHTHLGSVHWFAAHAHAHAHPHAGNLQKLFRSTGGALGLSGQASCCPSRRVSERTGRIRHQESLVCGIQNWRLFSLQRPPPKCPQATTSPQLFLGSVCVDMYTTKYLRNAGWSPLPRHDIRSCFTHSIQPPAGPSMVRLSYCCNDAFQFSAKIDRHGWALGIPENAAQVVRFPM